MSDGSVLPDPRVATAEEIRQAEEYVHLLRDLSTPVEEVAATSRRLPARIKLLAYALMTDPIGGES